MNLSEYSRASADHPDRCEDAIMTFVGNNGSHSAPVFAVIDGMGGHQRTLENGTKITGREAALMVRETLVEDLLHLPSDVDASPGGAAEQRLTAAINRAHDRIVAELNDNAVLPIEHRVGAVATVVIVCEDGKRLLTGQVGDTRGYLLTDGELIQLCYDEDNIQFLVNQGLLSDEDGARITDLLNSYDGVNEPKTDGVVHIGGTPYELYIAWRWFLVGNSVLNIPAANIVINALGINAPDPVSQMSRIEVSPGDSLFLCSDGVYKNLTEAEMIDAISQQDEAANTVGEKAYARSIADGNRRSTKDDVSAVVVRL